MSFHGTDKFRGKIKMANTSISDIASRIVQNPSQAKITEGRIGTDCYPGQAVVMISGVWILAVSSTAAHKLKTGGIIVWRARKNNDAGNPSIDATYDIDNEPYTDKIGVCTKGICAAFLTDQTATVDPGAELIISSTAGSLTSRSQEATGATSGTAFRSALFATLARTIVSGDTKGFVAVGYGNKLVSY